MAKDKVAKFVSECAQAKQVDSAKSIEIGPTIWMLGSPAPAADGMVGLATTPTQTVYFRREDLLDARESDGRFLILIPADTNLLVREEQVLRLNPESCKCNEQSGAIAKKKKGGTSSPNPGPIIIDCTPVCSFETVCSRHVDSGSGAVIMVCWPQFVCRNPCETIMV